MVKGYSLLPAEGVAALAQEASASYKVFAPDKLRPSWACPAWSAQSASRFEKEADWRAGKAVAIDLSVLPDRCHYSG